MKLKIVISLVIIVIICSCQNEEGFTKVNDISFRISELGYMPEAIDECSGIAYTNNQLFVINDSGAEQDFLILDPISMTSQHIELPIQNKDWETIIYYNQDLIIADIGNNKGERDTLFLHHIDVSTLTHVHTTSFMYPEQTTTWSENHNFDCEGMAIIDNNYYLFTKNRTNSYTNIYKAPIFTSHFKLVDSIQVPLRVTDVYFDESVGVILLLCNQKIDDTHVSYIMAIQNNSDSTFTKLACIPLSLDDKIEGITLKSDCTYYIGSERESGGSGKLYEIEIRGL